MAVLLLILVVLLGLLWSFRITTDPNAVKVQGPDSVGSNLLPVLQYRQDGTLCTYNGFAVDGISTSSTPGAMSATLGMTCNGTSIDRLRGNLSSTPLVAQTGTLANRNSADQTNYNGRGLALHLKVAALAGVPSFQAQVQWKDNDGNYVTIWQATAVTANGDYTYLLYPGAVAGTGSQFTAISGVAVPRTFRVNLVYTGNGTTDKADTTLDLEILL